MLLKIRTILYGRVAKHLIYPTLNTCTTVRDHSKRNWQRCPCGLYAWKWPAEAEAKDGKDE
jgi:hypothetical protein